MKGFEIPASMSSKSNNNLLKIKYKQIGNEVNCKSGYRLYSLPLHYSYDALPNKRWSLFSTLWIWFDIITCFGYKKAVEWRCANSESRTPQALHAFSLSVPLPLSLFPLSPLTKPCEPPLSSCRRIRDHVELRPIQICLFSSKWAADCWYLNETIWDQKKSTGEFSPNCQPTEPCIIKWLF